MTQTRLYSIQTCKNRVGFMSCSRVVSNFVSPTFEDILSKMGHFQGYFCKTLVLQITFEFVIFKPVSQKCKYKNETVFALSTPHLYISIIFF